MAITRRPVEVVRAKGNQSTDAWLPSFAQWTVGFLAVCAVVGAAAGWLWNRFPILPEFVTGEDRTLAISERSSMQIFTPDAGFVLIGLVVGIGLGVLAWYWGRRIGWPLAVVTTIGGLLAAGSCWLTGWAIGPRNFDQRVALAQPGELVPIDFTLRSPVAVLVWAIAALLPIFLYSTLSGEPDEVHAEPEPSKAATTTSPDPVRRH